MAVTTSRPTTPTKHVRGDEAIRSCIAAEESSIENGGMDFTKAFGDAMPDLIVSAVTGFFIATIGFGLTYHWNHRQKERELDLAMSESFHRLYGEFFATWKLWNYFIRNVGVAVLPETLRWELLKRAADAEGQVEAIVGRLASHRTLTSEAVRDLGRFRQAYQTLRESIRDNVAIEWESSSVPEYVAFKELATSVAAMIRSGKRANSSGSRTRKRAWLEITSNRWERR